ncbi:uncharacterized protein LOC124412624 [Diprion similis]|uniref:uncharacterized protein LOC124412624 n=1 Tax=Diprion similis TaxID=362088 RepID=UPI001EF8F0D9|nr:uncharacterized protein LOC124412624 [Diprion similis]
MRKFYFFVLFYLCFVWRLAASADTTDTEDDTPYCLRFTWLGPLYDKTSTVNISCDDYTGTPCIEPLIVTNDGSEPNVTYMWANYNRSIIGCPLRSGYSCIKYTYVYDNAVINASYFCGKMIQDTTTALTSGCYEQKITSHTIGACACQTNAGEAPCNASTTNVASICTQTLFFLLLLIFCYGSIFS